MNEDEKKAIFLSQFEAKLLNKIQELENKINQQNILLEKIVGKANILLEKIVAKKESFFDEVDPRKIKLTDKLSKLIPAQFNEISFNMDKNHLIPEGAAPRTKAIALVSSCSKEELQSLYELFPIFPE